jgi:alkylhydroperoxidase/carboxymuconolactone decarboxylase family protein YurZ
MFDICIRDFGLPFEMHIQMALANDVPLADIHELILFAAADAGHPTTFGSLKRFKEVCSELELDLPTRVDVQAAPVAVRYFEGLQAPPLETDLLQLWARPMVRFWEDGTLGAKERAYLSMIANIAQQVLGPPFAHHARIALKHGATPAELTALLTFSSEFGFSRAWSAAIALAEVLKSLA